MKKLYYEDLQERVYRAIKDMMLKGELRANEKLGQEALAQKLGVSRTPLLRAFSKLEKDMLVVNVPRRGVFVKQFAIEELVNIYDIRLRLEPLGAHQAAEHANAEDIARLEELSERFSQAVKRDRIEQIKEADYSLHMEIMRQSKNALLYDMIAGFNIILISNLKGLQKSAGKSETEHRQLLQAIAGHDAEGAEKVMYDHILESRNVLYRELAVSIEAGAANR